MSTLSNLSNKYYDLCRYHYCLNEHIDSLTSYVDGLKKYDIQLVSQDTYSKAMQLLEETEYQINILSEHSEIILLQIKTFQAAIETLENAVLNAEKMHTIAGIVVSNIIDEISDLI